MATAATENPIAPASVAIDVQEPASAPAPVPVAESATSAAPASAPAAPVGEPPKEAAAESGKASKGGKAAKNYRQAEERPDYKVICCGNSCLDLLLIPLTLVFLYGAMIGLSLLVLWGVFLTSATGAAHWIYFFAWFIGVVCLGIAVYVAEYEKYLKKQKEKQAQAEGTNA